MYNFSSEEDKALAQKTYDKVKSHLLAQKARSFCGGNCMYRSPHGLKCAVGCLILDEDYLPSMEGYSAGNTHVLKAVAKNGYFPSHEFLNTLQSIHDLKHPSVWEESLMWLAKEHGLIP